jgi:CRISPR-associated exonuclease Cas4
LYKEEDFLQLSGIQHFSYCRRQWALICLEVEWEENDRTFEGRLLHEKAHDPFIKETRNNYFISRAMPVHSYTLGLSGECDVVIFYENKNGINIIGKTGKYLPVPVEYKKGKPKNSIDDIVQLGAQAICLEEMLFCSIPYGYLYYGETHHREKVEIDQNLKNHISNLCNEMHEYAKKRYVPHVRRNKGCNACSLKNHCFPEIYHKESVNKYIARYTEDMKNA